MEVYVIDDDSDDDGIVVNVDDEDESRIAVKFSLLKDSFPDADNDFLQTKSVEYAWDDIGFNLFLDRMFSDDFPKIKENSPPKVTTVEIEFDPSTRPEFNVEEYLKKYPDPVEHFSQKMTSFMYLRHTTKYLLSRFRYIKTDVIRAAIKRNHYRLYNTYHQLYFFPNTRKKPRKDAELPEEYGRAPEEFYDEIDLIEHEDEIEMHNRWLVTARFEAVKEARKNNLIFTCGCCMADDVLLNEISNCSEGHIFCRNCIKSFVNVRIGDGRTDFPCLQECTGFFSTVILKDVLPENTYEHTMKMIQTKEITAANIPGLQTCPNCSYSAILPETNIIFDCLNCGSKTCRYCHRKEHIPYKCSEIRDESVEHRVFVEESMTEALLRKCYKCGTQFLRDDGCNKMVCVCGAKMCYICRQPIKCYSHFRTNDADKSSDKCPLWTSNKVAHDKAVAAEGKRAIEELKRKNPDLDVEVFSRKKK